MPMRFDQRTGAPGAVIARFPARNPNPRLRAYPAATRAVHSVLPAIAAGTLAAQLALGLRATVWSSSDSRLDRAGSLRVCSNAS